MKKFLSIFTCILIISCSNASIYRVTVTQGTVFEREDVERLDIGMSKDQVIFVMGNPSFENFFEENVWNYFYQVKSGDNILEEKRIKVFFDTDGFLNDIEIIKLD